MSSRETTAQTWKVIAGDTITGMATLPEASVHACITSPPYWGLRDYGVAGQIGLESTPSEYVARMVEVFRAVRRVLRDDGTCWVNLGDSYTAGAGNRNGMNESTLRGKTYGRGCMGDKPMSGLDAGVRPKNLVGIPWRVAFALQDDGWYLRQDIIWHKPNPMPESVTDRCTKAHEYLFLLSKSARYHFDAEAIQERSTLPTDTRPPNGSMAEGQRRAEARRMPPIGGVKHTENGHNQTAVGNTPEFREFRNRRDVWTIPTQPFPGAHFAVFPEALVEPCVKAGCPLGGTVLDPFNGSGTTGVVALKQGRSYVGCELNPEYVAMSRRRLADVAPLLAQEVA